MTTAATAAPALMSCGGTALRSTVGITAQDPSAVEASLELDRPTRRLIQQGLGDETLCDIARELVTTVRGNVTIDWTLRENVRAKLRLLVKRILRKHGYPPDKQDSATRTVLEQADVLSAGWTE